MPGYDMAPHFAPEGVVSAPEGLGVVEDFKALKRLAPGRHLKVALPGPLTFAGFMSDTFSSSTAFLGLAAIAALGFATVWLLMPETRPVEDGLSHQPRRTTVDSRK